MELSYIVFGGLLVALVGYGIWQIYTGQLNPDVDEDGDFDKQDIYELTWRLQRAVEIFAPAADQLVKLGELDKAERKEYVLTTIYKYLGDVDPDLAEVILEGWVWKNKDK